MKPNKEPRAGRLPIGSQPCPAGLDDDGDDDADGDGELSSSLTSSKSPRPRRSWSRLHRTRHKRRFSNQSSIGGHTQPAE